MIEKRPLGKTGLMVSRLALGGLPLCGRSSLGHAADVIRRAAELGINFIDTSPSYFDSETQIGNALRQVDAEFIVGTKLGNLPYETYRCKDKDFLRRELEFSYQSLRLDKVAILYVHEPDRPELHDWWIDKDKYEGPVLELLEEYRDKGKVDFFGLGGTTTTELARLIDSKKFQVVLSACQYSMLWQEATHSVFPAARRNGVGVVAGGIMQQGALSQVFYHDVVEEPMRWMSEPRRRQFMALYELVDDCGIPLPELALRFVLSNPDVATILTGVPNVEQLEQNVAAYEKGPLPQELLDRINEIYRMVPFRPFGEPFAPWFQAQLDDFKKREAEVDKFIAKEVSHRKS